MNMPKLLYYELFDFQAENIKYMEDNFDFLSLPGPNNDTDKILQKAEVIFAPMGFAFNKNKIDKCKSLQVIASPTTDVPHIDANYARERNISICSLKDEKDFLSSITSTAELTWGLILAVTRRIPRAHASVCQGKWDGRAFGKYTPQMLSNMSLGIVGLGRLGSLVAMYGKCFKMEVYYYDPYVNNNQYGRCDDLYDLAAASDIVSIHAYLTEETENLIDRKFINFMPKGSYIINTARGGIVDESALLEGLQSGHLGGAGLDMLKDEHLQGFKQILIEHPLIEYAKSHDNLIITPKIGGCTLDAWGKTERHIIDITIQELKNRGKM